MALFFLQIFSTNMYQKLDVSRVFFQTCQPIQGLALPKLFLKVHATHFYVIVVKSYSLYFIQVLLCNNQIEQSCQCHLL